jgi:hypothetical protein
MNAPSLHRAPNAILAVLLAGLLAPAVAEEGESLTYDPATGIYTVEYYNTYDGPTPVLKRAQFELPTRIDPTVKSKVKESEQGRISYQYKVRNGTDAKQDLNFIRLSVSQIAGENQNTPRGWEGYVNPQIDVPGFLVSWSQLPPDGTGLRPAQSQSGFGFGSHDLPGVGILEVWGRVRRDLGGFPDVGPTSDTAIGRQYLELIRSNDSVKRPAAVPRIPVPSPFDGAVVLESLRTHITQDIVELKLIEPVFASQLDRILQAAADAIRRNSVKAAREYLHEALVLVHKEHADLVKEDDETDDDNGKPKAYVRSRSIDRLAARVIAFDLKYVEKRLKNAGDAKQEVKY